jgi:DNA-binding PadR family transcriptional regulator
MLMPESIPLAPAGFFILFALAAGDKHGYAIMQEAKKLSDGQFEMGPATLYTNIQRLIDSGRIKEVPGPEGSDSRRRYYRITRDGNAALSLELGRMDAMVRKSKALKLRPSEARS